jgi:hypothetical protein
MTSDHITNTSKETAAQRRDRKLLAAATKYRQAIRLLREARDEGLELDLCGMRLDIPKSVYLYRTDGHGRIHKVLEGDV